MTIFAVLCPPTNPAILQLRGSVERAFPDAWFEIASGQYFVSARGLTAQEIASKLEVITGMLGQVVVFKTSSQRGFHRKDLWDWLDAKAEQ